MVSTKILHMRYMCVIQGNAITTELQTGRETRLLLRISGCLLVFSKMRTEKCQEAIFDTNLVCFLLTTIESGSKLNQTTP